MLDAKRSADVTPDMNLRNLLLADDKARKRLGPTWFSNPGQMSHEVQNRSISSPTIRTDVLRIVFLKK